MSSRSIFWLYVLLTAFFLMITIYCFTTLPVGLVLIGILTAVPTTSFGIASYLSFRNIRFSSGHSRRRSPRR